jgi:peroxiredoxin
MASLSEHKRYRDEYMAMQKRREAHTPKVGEQAPDFELGLADGKGTVRLSDFAGKRPVALIFGSYT